MIFINSLHQLLSIIITYNQSEKKQVSFYYIGSIQHPENSIIALVTNDISISHRPIGIKSNDSKFSIEDEQSEYLGK
jgi:hypothetical protein